MDMVKVADLKNNLSRHLTRIRKGGSITVYDRDTPVARLVPFDHGQPGAAVAGKRTVSEAASAQRVADLARQGIVSAGSARAVADWLRDHEPIERPAGAPSAVDALLEMRRDSRR